MKYIKTTHDVLGLEDRVKVVIKTSTAQNKVSAINSVYLTDGTDNYTLYRKPSKSSTQMWITLKKGTDPQVVDDTLDANTATAEGEVLVKITVTGVASGLDAINAFAQGADTTPWGCYGPSTMTIEARRAPHITGISMNLKPTNYEANIPSVHASVYRGVRRVVSDPEIPGNGILNLTFPV